MMLVIGSYQVVVGISEIGNSTWILNLTNDWRGPGLLVWGLVDVVVGAMALYASRDILRGGRVGQFLGFLFAAVGVLKWLIFLPATPALAVVIIVLDVLIIYGLAHNSDYFETSL